MTKYKLGKKNGCIVIENVITKIGTTIKAPVLEYEEDKRIVYDMTTLNEDELELLKKAISINPKHNYVYIGNLYTDSSDIECSKYYNFKIKDNEFIGKFIDDEEFNDITTMEDFWLDDLEDRYKRLQKYEDDTVPTDIDIFDSRLIETITLNVPELKSGTEKELRFDLSNLSTKERTLLKKAIDENNDYIKLETLYSKIDNDALYAEDYAFNIEGKTLIGYYIKIHD